MYNETSSPKGVDFTAEVVDFSPGKHSRNNPRVREKYKGLVSKSEIPSEPPGYVSLFTVITRQLSVEKAMAKRAADTREKMEAKHKVTALQKAILRV